MELKLIVKALEFSNSLQTRIGKDFLYMFKFLKAFGNIYNEELNKLPYHINIIDELNADENSHSRIFAKLLGYGKLHGYPILERFLNKISNFSLNIENPEIEKIDSCGRIDIPIFDKTYVVIIENKITDKAPDQNTTNGGQLARYIESIRNSYYRNFEEIYVVYTAKTKKEPPKESWVNKNNV